MSFAKISALVKKEFVLEFRQRASFAGIILYLVGCIYLSYLAFIGSELKDRGFWNALLWIILLFNSIISVSKSFASEVKGRALYNYTIYDPRHLILAKLFYNMLLVLVVSLTGFFFYGWFIGNLVKNIPLFVVNICLASMAFSGILTMTTGIASKINGSFTLISVLSIPLLFPLMLIAMRISLLAALGSSFAGCAQYLMALGALNVMVIVLCYLLFPYLWKE
ncbi:MAG: heme exporter protein CcmB [Bacteroidia bacterium]|nr:heme exporter protein CcmB [Bacteroidia bacterium]